MELIEIRNLLITIAYVGTNYHGFQIQKNAVTVQAVFQEALHKTLSVLPDIKGCSRTDTGVHAKQYCISVQTDSEIAAEKLRDALNFHLPLDIRVFSVQEVLGDFHARYSCKGKQYQYLVYNSREIAPFLVGRALQFFKKIDEEKLNNAAQRFVGTHDFLPFSGNKRSVEDTVRTVSRFSVTRDGDLISFEVKADGFLYHMVRIMVGTLLSIARGTLQPEDIDWVFETGQRLNGCFTAPPEGLYLDRVFYDLEADG